MAASSVVLNPCPLEYFSAPVTRHSVPRRTATDYNLASSGAADKPILVFVATLGPGSSMVPLEVYNSDTIESVKVQLQALHGFYVGRPRLVHAGRVLSQDHKLLQDCGIRSGDILHLVLRLSDLVSITVQTVNGKSYVYTGRRTDRVGDLKKHISNREGGLPLGSQVLTLKGEHLEDSTVLRDLSFGGEVVLWLIVQKPFKLPYKAVNRTDVEVAVAAFDGLGKPDCFKREIPLELEGALIPHEASPVAHVRRNDHLPQLQLGIDSAGHHSCLSLSNFSIQSELTEGFRDLVEQVRMGLRGGQAPVLASEGSGGVYFLKDECGLRNLAVFKPMDEEPMAVNNPRGFSSTSRGEGLKKGTRIGEGAIREVAAFILDHPLIGPRNGMRKGEGFAGVPPTAMVRCYHQKFNYTVEDISLYKRAKIGSLQQFVRALSSCEDMGSSMFPVEEVHKITVLDLRLANADRNGGNILVCKGADEALKLVPIDHGYCLPDKFEECTFEWLYWPQARQPYGPSTLKYIESLDAERDIALLQQCGWFLRPQVARILRVSTMLLKKGATAGLTPFQIGSIVSRVNSLDTKSPVELMLDEAEARRSKKTSEQDFLETLACLLDDHIAGVKKSIGPR